MHIAYYKEFSQILNRDMEFKIYGHAGKPCIVFPAQDGNFFDFENFEMIKSIENKIIHGHLQLFCIQSIDQESWSSYIPYHHDRIMQHEKWFSYVCDELIPRLYAIHNTTAHEHYTGKFMTTGVSMGAYHALNFLLRRPDLFDTTIALSGIYHADHFFPNYNDEVIYINSPVDFLKNMNYDDPYVEKYRQCRIILCCGLGKWEEEGIKDCNLLKTEFERLAIPAWIDFWGQDVDHDWTWWQKQLPYFMDQVLSSC